MRVPTSQNFERAVELLLDRGADINAEDSSALINALQCGNEDGVALLEAKGAKKLTSEQLDDALIDICEDREPSYRDGF